MVLGSILDAHLQRTEQARALEHVQREAETDHLTGLLNRRGWDRRLALEEVRFARFGDPAAVLVLDLDGLKECNDAEGHRAGDRHLVRTGDVLRAVTRPADVVARLGGDEFGVLAGGVPPDDAVVLVGRLLAALAAAGVAASIGDAPYRILDGLGGGGRRRRRRRVRRQAAPLLAPGRRPGLTVGRRPQRRGRDASGRGRASRNSSICFHSGVGGTWPGRGA